MSSQIPFIANTFDGLVGVAVFFAATAGNYDLPEYGEHPGHHPKPPPALLGAVWLAAIVFVVLAGVANSGWLCCLLGLVIMRAGVWMHYDLAVYAWTCRARFYREHKLLGGRRSRLLRDVR